MQPRRSERTTPEKTNALIVAAADKLESINARLAELTTDKCDVGGDCDDVRIPCSQCTFIMCSNCANRSYENGKCPGCRVAMSSRVARSAIKARRDEVKQLRVDLQNTEADMHVLLGGESTGGGESKSSTGAAPELVPSPSAKISVRNDEEEEEEGKVERDDNIEEKDNEGDDGAEQQEEEVVSSPSVQKEVEEEEEEEEEQEEQEEEEEEDDDEDDASDNDEDDDEDDDDDEGNDKKEELTDEEEVLQWFNTLSFLKKKKTEFLNLFIRAGIDDMDTLREVNEAMLEKIGIKPIKRMLFMEAIVQLSSTDEPAAPAAPAASKTPPKKKSSSSKKKSSSSDKRKSAEKADPVTKEQQDVLEAWFEECCTVVVNEQGGRGKSVLFALSPQLRKKAPNSYENYCKEKNVKPVKSKQFDKFIFSRDTRIDFSTRMNGTAAFDHIQFNCGYPPSNKRCKCGCRKNEKNK